MTRDADTYLTEREIESVTRKKYGKAQARVLAEKGWPFTLDGAGKPVVLRSTQQALLGLKPTARRRAPRLSGLAA